MELKNLEAAYKEFKAANAGGQLDPRYGELMLDRSTGEVWTDVFNSLGRNTWKEYHDESIVNLLAWARKYSEHWYRNDGYPSLPNIKVWAEEALKSWEDNCERRDESGEGVEE